jgi:two-component system, sensor histidine kinase and response regulator
MTNSLPLLRLHPIPYPLHPIPYPLPRMEDDLKVLIVDDDTVDRMLVRRSLKNAGMNVSFSEAENCAQALQILAHESFECIFVDYQLPDRDGLSLVQCIRELNIKSPIVALTGHGDEQIAVDLMKAGASDYLTKSRISPESLSQILRNAVRIYRAEAEIVMQRADFIAHLTHDLRTPLVAADMMLKLFKKAAFGALPPEMEPPLTAMIRSNQNLLDMVNILLEVNCYEAGEKILTPIVCNMWQICQEVIQELEPLAQDKGLELKLTVIGDTPDANDKLLVMGDCQEIRRMITNLVGNSLKFTEEGSVELRLQLAPPRAEDPPTITGWVTLDVQDTGLGMSAEQQANIFHRYRKGSHKQAGSGLGLHLAQRIVTVHQGTIQVNSTVGHGSLFTIHLPLHTDTLPTCSDNN